MEITYEILDLSQTSHSPGFYFRIPCLPSQVEGTIDMIGPYDTHDAARTAAETFINEALAEAVAEQENTIVEG